MTGVDHYLEAERLLTLVANQPHDDHELLTAQVHATLALAAATAMQAYSRPDDTELDEWGRIAGGIE